MSQRRPLRFARRTRSVENNRRITRRHRDRLQNSIRRISSRQRAIGRHVKRSHRRALSPGENLATNRTVLHQHRRGCLRRQTSTRKRKKHLRPAIAQMILQLSTRQQRIQRNTNRTRSHNAVIQRRHQRHIRHRQRHSVTTLNTERRHMTLDLRSSRSQLRVAHHLHISRVRSRNRQSRLSPRTGSSLRQKVGNIVR